MRIEAQHVHVRLLREGNVRLDQVVRCGIEKELGAIAGASHEHRPGVDGKGPAFGPGLQARLANSECLAETGATAFVRRDVDLRPIQGGLTLRPGRPELRVGQGQFDDDVLDIVAVEAKRATHLERRPTLEVIRLHAEQQLAGHDPPVEIAQPQSEREPGQVALFQP